MISVNLWLHSYKTSMVNFRINSITAKAGTTKHTKLKCGCVICCAVLIQPMFGSQTSTVPNVFLSH